MIDGINCDYRRVYALAYQLTKAFGHKTTAYLIPFGGIKRGKRENMQPG
jgi:hypothetical protein